MRKCLLEFFVVVAEFGHMSKPHIMVYLYSVGTQKALGMFTREDMRIKLNIDFKTTQNNQTI